MITFLATEMQKHGHQALFLGSDINALAAQVATDTARLNGVRVFDIARTDLLQCYEPRIRVGGVVEAAVDGFKVADEGFARAKWMCCCSTRRTCPRPARRSARRTWR